MTAPELRPYQSALIERTRAALRVNRRVVVQAPTGAGKTVLTAHMIREAAARGYSAWFCVHRRELLAQTSRALNASEVPHGLIAAGRLPSDAPVQVASVQTLVRRLDDLEPPNMLIIDEAHHASAATYRTIIEHCPDAWVIGLTATPCRSDGRGLDDLFEDLVLGPPVAELIEAGYLSPYRVIVPGPAPDLTGVRTRMGEFVREELEGLMDQGGVIRGNVEHYLRFVAPRNCLVYCVSRRHARHVEEAYQAAGVDALYCAGDTPELERGEIVDRFRRGDLPVIVSVDLFGEGLDVPGLAAVQLLRPTQSLGLHLQQIGRALRVEPGKREALVLDQAGNTFRHGLPDDDRAWTLAGRPKRLRGTVETPPALRSCEKCFAVYSAAKAACPSCGLTHVVEGRQPEEVAGELVEIDPEEHRRLRQQENRQANTLAELVALALRRGHKVAWAGVQWALRRKIDRTTAIKLAYAEAKKLRGEH